MDYTTLRYEVKNNVAVITFCRPERYNMFTVEVWEELLDCQQRIIGDEEVRAVLICAEGKHFSSGIDMNMLNSLPASVIRRLLAKYQQAYYGFSTLEVPVIAAIQGKCLGNAAELLLSCDLRMAAANAKFAFLEVKYAGISPDFGGTAKLGKLIGIGRAKRLLLTGEVIDAEEAKNIGLIEYTVEPEKLLEEAFKLAQGIAAQPPLGVMACTKGLELAQDGSVNAARLYEQMQAAFCAASEDFHEAINASQERRMGKYYGK